MKCDPESQALWNELKIYEIQKPRSRCCNTLLAARLIGFTYVIVTIGGIKNVLPTRFCPVCGRKLEMK